MDAPGNGLLVFITTDYLRSTCVDLRWVTKRLKTCVLASKFELDQSQRKSTQVIASRYKSTQVGGQMTRKLNASPKRASTCESVWPGLWSRVRRRPFSLYSRITTLESMGIWSKHTGAHASRTASWPPTVFLLRRLHAVFAVTKTNREQRENASEKIHDHQAKERRKIFKSNTLPDCGRRHYANRSFPKAERRCSELLGDGRHVKTFKIQMTTSALRSKVFCASWPTRACELFGILKLNRG